MKKNYKEKRDDMQTFNYHGHTKRCGHAEGEDEAYVIEAIKNGYKKIGFSDHMPYKDGFVEANRMHDYELEDYVSSIKRLQEKYKDQIDIYIGLEFENYQEQMEEIKANRERFDYMILGEHEVALFAPDFYTNFEDKDTALYGEMVVKAIHDGLPDYVAHPDLFMFGKEEWNDTCIEVTHAICKAAQAHRVPLELNLNGLKFGKCKRGKETRYLYPYRKFWEIVSMYEIDVLFGLDAHSPEKYSDFDCFDIVKNEIVNGISLNFIEDLSFKHKI